MGNKIKKILSMLLIGIMIGATPAIASPPEPIPGSITITWEKLQGVPIEEKCTDGTTYLLWIFTTDGYTTGSPDPKLTLVVGGVSKSYDGVDKGKINGEGSWHFNTPYYDPASITSASVFYTYADLGKGQLNLVISHGCSIPEFPTVALPIAAVIGLVFFFQNKKRKEE